MTKDEILQELLDISEEIEQFSVILALRIKQVGKQIGKAEEPDGYDEYGRAIKYVDDGRGGLLNDKV